MLLVRWAAGVVARCGGCGVAALLVQQGAAVVTL
jgi:hypothetical protein